MSRKLNAQERADIEAIRDALCKAMSPAQRSLASGIASGLVRSRGKRVTEKDLDRILGKYEDTEAGKGLRDLVKSEVLGPAEDGDGFELAVHGVVEEDEADAQAADDAEAQTQAGDAGERPEDGDPEPVSPAEAADVTAADGAPDAADAADGDDDGQAETSQPEAAGPSPTGGAPSSDQGETNESPSQGTPSAGDQAVPKADAAPAQDGVKPAREGGRHSRRSPRRLRKRGRDEDSVQGKPAGTGSGPNAERSLSHVPYVRRGGEADVEAREKILQLDQRFWLNGWLLSHPSAYTMYEPELKAINEALSDGMLPGDITRRQLAYQMGGDEKFFEYGSDGFKLLRAMGVEDIVRHRPMPKADLIFHAPRRRKHMRVLVTENLDPWLDVHDLMYEDGRTTVLGERIHAVVLGGGTPVLERNRLALLLDSLGADSVEVLYWGDIDRAGLEIMDKLRAVLGERYPFASFVPAYRLMVQRAMERYPNPEDNEATGQVNIEVGDLSLLLSGMSEEEAAYATAVIEGCRLIPQEILTRRDL
jgi:hypothetical protein